MAIGGAISSGENVHYNGKVTITVLLSCIIAATGGLLFGYDTGVTGGVTSMEPFLKKFFPEVYTNMNSNTLVSNYCKFDSQLLTAFSSSIYVSGLIASFFASRVTMEYGRKRSIICGGIAFFSGAAIGGAAENLYTLMIGRLLLGVGVGFANQAVPLYLSEMAPSKYRGAFNFSFQCFLSIGSTGAFLLNYVTSKISGDLGWRISLATALVPASVLILGTLFLPETPNSLIQRGEDARKLLQKIRGTDDVDAELDDLLSATYAAQQMKAPFGKILKRRYRPYLVMAVAIPFFQQMTGIAVISFYAPILFRTIGSDESGSLKSSLITSSLGIFSTALSSLLVDRVGRRVIFVVGGALMLATQLAIGGIMAEKLGDYGVLSPGYNAAIVVLICVYVTAFGFSWGPLGWLVTSEIFPLEIRSAGQSITVAVSFLFSFVIGQVFLAILCHLKSGTFFFFGGWVALMTGFVFFLLPETKNVPIEKMDRIWREHWFWRRYMSYDEDDLEWMGGDIEEPFLKFVHTLVTRKAILVTKDDVGLILSKEVHYSTLNGDAKIQSGEVLYNTIGRHHFDRPYCTRRCGRESFHAYVWLCFAQNSSWLYQPSVHLQMELEESLLTILLA
ncbi:major facilitator superfamily protein [Striga asiatica]|uniref:Major facilitator superfamily protein n=1 Tax=Striga asiatica TaxID=4170 RepID=A0A5A7QMJ5_STRAF|nr:major facilitator superfamily protein [Striga asiatica]